MNGPYRIQARDEKRHRYDDVRVIYDQFGPVDWEWAGSQPATEFKDWEDAISDMENLPGRAIYCCIDMATKKRFFDSNGPA